MKILLLRQAPLLQYLLDRLLTLLGLDLILLVKVLDEVPFCHLDHVLQLLSVVG